MTDRVLATGSWSNGTLRDEDWAETLLDMARSVGIFAGMSAAPEWVCALEHALDALTDEDHECDESECRAAECASEAILDAQDALQEYAPIYCYVGSAEGDGAALGVWMDAEALSEAIRGGNRIDAETVENTDDGVRIHVSDHGNVEVYALDGGASLLATT